MHIEGKYHVNLKTESRVRLLEGKEHQGLPTSPQKLGAAWAEPSEGASPADTSSLGFCFQDWETIQFCCLLLQP